MDQIEESIAVSPWENGCEEPFNCKLRDESLSRELFDTLLEGKCWWFVGKSTAIPSGRIAC